MIYSSSEMADEGFNIIVLLKQVPDIEEVKFDTEKGTLDRSSAKAEPNPFDLNALEAGVQIKEELGGTVTVVSMGPPQAESALRDALARGSGGAPMLVVGLMSSTFTEKLISILQLPFFMEWRHARN